MPEQSDVHSLNQGASAGGDAPVAPARPRFFIGLRNDAYVPLGWKFALAVLLLVLVTFGLTLLPKETPDWVEVVANIVIGAVFGLALQPVPERPSNRTHAEFAVASLADTTTSVSGSKVAVEQLLQNPDLTDVVVRLHVVQSQLDQTLNQLVNSLEEWNRLEPGVTDRVLLRRQQRADLAQQLGLGDQNGE
ncbi:hypothetical protein [Curtobacterium flaccumfaciens]|uniref:hypothetical protein n=1 Tax=Curtobacterium flaccumfaciens TaxID=2035 RepID=UPI003996896F